MPRGNEVNVRRLARDAEQSQRLMIGGHAKLVDDDVLHTVREVDGRFVLAAAIFFCQSFLFGHLQPAPPVDTAGVVVGEVTAIGVEGEVVDGHPLTPQLKSCR